MKPRELRNLGVPKDLIPLAGRCAADALRSGHSRASVRSMVRAVIADHTSDRLSPHLQPLADAMAAQKAKGELRKQWIEPEEPAPWKQWGEDLDPKSIDQLRHACRLPIAVQGALMPDAHVGYGLPIGGVLATENAVIPYAVGVDIACRMKMTVLDTPVNAIEGQTDRLVNVLNEETRFGIGAKFTDPNDHPVLDADWTVSEVAAKNKDKARAQLGSSGSGNHFVEFGVLTPRTAELGLEIDRPYLAVLSHSGSRGVGAAIADHYSKLAMSIRPELPRELKHLAWLSLDSEAGQAYWAAMNLMGDYAAANHEIIHRRVARALKADVLADVENHHNFAWKEVHDGREVIVHRKGATPAGDGVLGVIPGSMADPAYVVRGRGEASSLASASHGAGRVMSRRQAKASFRWSSVKKLLRERQVTLISAGLDEVPGVYKNIDEVMAAQTDLVDVVARFDPRIVKMADAGERPED